MYKAYRKTMAISNFSKIFCCYLVIRNQKKNEGTIPSHNYASNDRSIIAPLQYDHSIRLILHEVFCNIFPTFSYISELFIIRFPNGFHQNDGHTFATISLISDLAQIYSFYASQGQAQPSPCLFKPTYLF